MDKGFNIPPINGVFTPYAWYIEPTFHGISNSLSMAYQTPYSWYIEPPSHGISNTLPMIFLAPYSWHIKPPRIVL
jgi:hypothetical protein